jgi:hypothetical protein
MVGALMVTVLKNGNSQLGSQLGSQLRSQLHSQLGSQLGSQLDLQLRSQLGSQLRSQLRSQLHSQLGSQLHSQLGSQLGSQLDSQLGDLTRVLYNRWLPAWWNSWYVYLYEGVDLINKYGTKIDPKILDLMHKRQAWDKTTSWCYLEDNFIVLCDRPLSLKVDMENEGRLHSTEEAAIEYSGGWKLFYLWGVNFTEELWTKVTQKQLSIAEVLALENMEQRMCALKVYGAEALLESANAKKLDEKSYIHKATGKTLKNELYLIDEKSLFSEPEYFLKYMCPSTDRVYVSCVDQEVGKNKNANECMAWKHHLSLEQYQSLINQGFEA